MNFLGALLAGSIILLVVLLAVGIVFYVLRSIGCMRVLKALGWQAPWMAWIPVLSHIALGLAINTDDNKSMKLFGLDIPTVVYAFWIVIYMIATRIPSVGGLIGLIVMIALSGRIYQNIYSRIEGKPESETMIIGFLSGWLGIIPMIKFLCYKSDK